MNSRDKILQKLNSYQSKKVDMPKFDIEAQIVPDKISAFIESVKQVGGEAVLLEEYGSIDNLIAKLFPDVKRIASNLPNIKSVTENPDEFESASELDGLDLGIVKGYFGVIENGSIWITNNKIKHKAIFFISEALIIILDKNELVENMHLAYKRPEIHEDFEYGCFISGPSKTADIEQALVIGAHGARAVTVVLK